MNEGGRHGDGGGLEVARTGDVAEGSMKKVRAGDHEILLAYIGGAYYAADARCPHMGGDLSRGTLAGTIVTCPLHHSQFDLAGGQVVRWTDWSGLLLSLAKAFRSPRPLTTYPVSVDGDRILVRI
ncbi:MAG: Rieske (2Fe-2S) protein [Methanomicrobiales archaeon]|nr:Rieske (2Fe-2S) protein [Methanomicrobiales archaeon]